MRFITRALSPVIILLFSATGLLCLIASCSKREQVIRKVPMPEVIIDTQPGDQCGQVAISYRLIDDSGKAVAAATLLERAEEYYKNEAYEPAKNVLKRIIRNFPGSKEAKRAKRLSKKSRKRRSREVSSTEYRVPSTEYRVPSTKKKIRDF